MAQPGGPRIAIDLDAKNKVVATQVIRIIRRDQLRIVERGDAVDDHTAPGDFLKPDFHIGRIDGLRREKTQKIRIELCEYAQLQAGIAFMGGKFRVLFLPQHPVEPAGPPGAGNGLGRPAEEIL